MRCRVRGRLVQVPHQLRRAGLPEADLQRDQGPAPLLSPPDRPAGRAGAVRPAGRTTSTTHQRQEKHMRRDESGAVTAETAMALPLIAIFALSMAWLVTIGITDVRAIDAARETSRAAARW